VFVDYSTVTGLSNSFPQ